MSNNQQSPTGEGITEEWIEKEIGSAFGCQYGACKTAAKAIMEKIAPLQEENERLKKKVDSLNGCYNEKFQSEVRLQQQISQLQSEIQRLKDGGIWVKADDRKPDHDDWVICRFDNVYQPDQNEKVMWLKKSMFDTAGAMTNLRWLDESRTTEAGEGAQIQWPDDSALET